MDKAGVGSRMGGRDGWGRGPCWGKNGQASGIDSVGCMHSAVGTSCSCLCTGGAGAKTHVSSVEQGK